jgi:hypothetical protein
MPHPFLVHHTDHLFFILSFRDVSHFFPSLEELLLAVPDFSCICPSVPVTLPQPSLAFLLPISRLTLLGTSCLYPHHLCRWLASCFLGQGNHCHTWPLPRWETFCEQFAGVVRSCLVERSRHDSAYILLQDRRTELLCRVCMNSGASRPSGSQIADCTWGREIAVVETWEWIRCGIYFAVRNI